MGEELNQWLAELEGWTHFGRLGCEWKTPNGLCQENCPTYSDLDALFRVLEHFYADYDITFTPDAGDGYVLEMVYRSFKDEKDFHVIEGSHKNPVQAVRQALEKVMEAKDDSHNNKSF